MSVRRSVEALRHRENTSLIPITPAAKAGIRVCIVDDERTLRESCASVLGAEGYTVVTVDRGDEALQTLKTRAFDIVLVDLNMSEVAGLELLQAVRAAYPGTIVIVMTGNPSVETSLEALRAGAWDYLPKPFTGTQLQILLGRAAHAVAVQRETRLLQARVTAEHGNSDKLCVLGSAPAFRSAIELARRVAATDASVFITGESGSGKELMAQFIHQHSPRASQPLVAVNCAALPELLLESEMFGHCKGAFTGAVRDKTGLLEVANGGTLFLDELIEMSKPIQAKLLRAIQDGVVRRVGSESSGAPVNVRFITATNRNPETAVKDGTLREDLFYRLRVVPIQVPSLRERPDDIPLLANHFLVHYWRRHRDANAPPPRLTRAAVWALRTYGWPGNVRELQNVIEHAVVLLEPGAPVVPEDIPFNCSTPAETVYSEATVELAADDSYYAARQKLIAKFARQYLTHVVLRAGGNLSKAARIARVDRTTFYRLMERHGLRRNSLATTPE